MWACSQRGMSWGWIRPEQDGKDTDMCGCGSLTLWYPQSPKRTCIRWESFSAKGAKGSCESKCNNPKNEDPIHKIPSCSPFRLYLIPEDSGCGSCLGFLSVCLLLSKRFRSWSSNEQEPQSFKKVALTAALDTPTVGAIPTIKNRDKQRVDRCPTD